MNKIVSETNTLDIALNQCNLELLQLLLFSNDHPNENLRRNSYIIHQFIKFITALNWYTRVDIRVLPDVFKRNSTSN